MILTIVAIWFIVGMCLNYCLFWFSSTFGEKVMVIIVWPFLFIWAWILGTCYLILWVGGVIKQAMEKYDT